MIEYKPDMEQVLARYEAWWEGQIVDRPVANITFPKPAEQRVAGPAEKSWPTVRDRWFDAEYIAARTAAAMANTVFYADALPVAYPNLGPEVFSAYYGCELEYGDRTSWSVPCLHDWSPASLAALQLNLGNPYFRKTIEITDALLAVGRGKFLVGYTDLHGGGDAIAAFRDPQELLIDVLERPAEVKALNDRITTDFLRVYDLFHARLQAAGMPSTSWCPLTCKGKYHIPSNDFSCMISTPQFVDLFLPGIVRECQAMDRCIYHLDGRQALRFLDLLLELPELDAIQWVPGAGHDYWGDWIDVYQRIQRAGKAVQVGVVPVQELPRLTELLKPEGIWIPHVSGITDADEAQAALRVIARWGK
jgi:hypothetical protein